MYIFKLGTREENMYTHLSKALLAMCNGPRAQTTPTHRRFVDATRIPSMKPFSWGPNIEHVELCVDVDT